MAILSLRPNVTRPEAVARFQGGSTHFIRWLGGAPLRSVADAYVPFHLYRVEVATGPASRTSWFAVDAVTGSLDPYEFDRVPDESELVRVETRNRPPPVLGETESTRLLEDKLRRVVFQTGFFRVRNWQFRAERVGLELHVPYWLGFYGREGAARLRVLDAVRRRFEGGKARTLFEGWLAAS